MPNGKVRTKRFALKFLSNILHFHCKVHLVLRYMPFGYHYQISSVLILELNSRSHPKYRSDFYRSEEHTSELQSRGHLVCRLLLEKNKKTTQTKMDNKLSTC